jgi:adenylate kinase
VRKVIDTSKISFTQDIILDSDVIIYDLTTCDLKEAEFAISTLKVSKSPEPKVLICVSTVMTWAKTPPKEKKEEEGEDADDGAGEEPDSEEEGKDEPAGGADEGEAKKTYVRFTDKDYTLRRPAPDYEEIKSVETLCLAAGKVRESLKSYVLCSGILYGNGEVVFRPYFEEARLQKPPELAYYGEGRNRIPTVHVKDLVTYVKKVVERPPAIQYLLAIDHNPKPTLKKIVESISSGVGTGKVRKLPVSEDVVNIDKLTLNLRMKPSMCFQKLEEE